MYAIFEYKQVIQLLPCHVSDIMQTALLITITLVWTQDSKHYKSVMSQKTHTLGILTEDLGQHVTLATRSFRLRFIQLQTSKDRSQLKQRGQTKNRACFKKPICFWESFSRISCDLWQKCPGLADKTCYVIFWPGTHWQWSPHLIHMMRVEIVTCTDCTDISCGLCMSLTPEPEPVSADVSSGGRGRCQ